MKKFHYVFVSLLLAIAFLLLLQPAAIVYAQRDVGFVNPLGSTTLTGFLTRVINYILGFVGLLALLAIIVGGARLIAGFGNEQQLKSAKTIIWWAVVGLAVVVLSFAMIRIVTTGFLGISDPVS